jgi:hypothetical protein
MGYWDYIFSGADSILPGGKRRKVQEVMRKSVRTGNAIANGQIRLEIAKRGRSAEMRLETVNYLIKDAKEYARRYGGSFALEPDVSKMYNELLKEYWASKEN